MGYRLPYKEGAICAYLGLSREAYDPRPARDPRGLIAHRVGCEGTGVGLDGRAVQEAGPVDVYQLHQDLVREGRALCPEVADPPVGDFRGVDLVTGINHGRG